MKFVAFYHKQVLSINLGHILVLLVWYSGGVQVLWPHIMTSIYRHKLICNSMQWSIRVTYDPPSWSILHSAYQKGREDDPHHLYQDTLRQSHPHIDKKILFSVTIFQLWMGLGNIHGVPCAKPIVYTRLWLPVLVHTCLLLSWFKHIHLWQWVHQYDMIL